MTRDQQQTRVRILGGEVQDGEWLEILEAARWWRSYGAPYKVVAQMIADDYGVVLDEQTVRRMLTGAGTDARRGDS